MANPNPKPPPKHAQWKKGRSGNPGGVPKGDPTFRERCRIAVNDHVIDAWINEVIARGPEWAMAAKLLAAYGYGNPTQRVEATGNDGGPMNISVTFVDVPEG